jgi:hypothetical protein
MKIDGSDMDIGLWDTAAQEVNPENFKKGL